MANQKVIGASPKVIETLKKANTFFNSTNLMSDKSTGRVLTTQMEGQLGGSSPLIPAKVKSGNGLIGYECDIFRDGLSEPPTEVGTVFLANGASTIFALPVGTIIFVQKCAIPVHGGVK
jgi:hypothetical protein